jgi:hypothetical protein
MSTVRADLNIQIAVASNIKSLTFCISELDASANNTEEMRRKATSLYDFGKIDLFWTKNGWGFSQNLTQFFGLDKGH